VSPENYPALFRSADAASNAKQCFYLNLVKTEYVALFLAAILFMEIFAGATFYLFYAFVFLIGLAALLTRALMKPEQHWYGCRALAESIKTLSWRYMMRAQPFAGTYELIVARAEFRNHLRALFDDNKKIVEMVASDWSDGDQITSEMDRIRGLSLDERKSLYTSDRVREQRSWYSRKAGENKGNACKWVSIGVAAYVLAIGLALSRIEFPDWHVWPIEPVIVFASSLVGWMQIKKFNELGVAYTVAAHEIGLIAPRIDDVTSEAEFSECVNDAELAFSREHTLWIARLST
jgi:conflict system pore-forming effector with SLATT domain